ncbi:hypothetical protein AB0F42_08030 [Streptomyces buecherae]|uniref:hypothetical protein n=1 Tax=Streptomyces buecherae TaxID=2763006 RepID=UPI0033D2428D
MRPLAAAALVGTTVALWPLPFAQAAERPARTPTYVCSSMTWSATAGATFGRDCVPTNGAPADGDIHGRFLLKGRKGSPTVVCPAPLLGGPTGRYDSAKKEVWASSCHRV